VEILKESVYEYPECSTEHQECKMVRSSYEDMIKTWLENPLGMNGIKIDIDDGITVTDIWKMALHGENSRIRKSEEMQIGLALKQIGWEKVRVKIDGKRSWRWYENGKHLFRQLA